LEGTQDLKEAFSVIVSKVLLARGIRQFHEEIAEQVYGMFNRRTVTLTRLNVGDVGVGLVTENAFGCLLQYVSDACGVKTFRELRTSTRPSGFRPFAEARAFVRDLGFASIYHWYDYCKSNTRPGDIPTNPNHVYHGCGWEGYRDWLGTERVWRDFTAAREFVRCLQLKTQAEWYAYCQSGNKPDDIPSDPHQVYAGQGWSGLGDWLGTGTVAPKNRKYRPFEKAREFVRSLHLSSQRAWSTYCKSGEKPRDIPATPYQVYRDGGWAGLADWLGTDTIPSQQLTFLPFIKARQFVHTLGLRTQGDWFDYCKSGQKPRNIPASPNVVYKGHGWKGLRDWLGTEKRGKKKRSYRPFVEARAFVRSLGLRDFLDWCEFSKSGKRPADIPSNPCKVYKHDGWVNLRDWLGTVVTEQSAADEPMRQRMPNLNVVRANSYC
jgi:hypothetical protein